MAMAPDGRGRTLGSAHTTATFSGQERDKKVCPRIGRVGAEGAMYLPAGRRAIYLRVRRRLPALGALSLVLGIACCTVDRNEDGPIPVLTMTPEEVAQQAALERAIEAAKVHPCRSELRFVDTGLGLWSIESPDGGSMLLLQAFPMRHRRMERVIEFHHDRMISLLRAGPRTITLLEVLRAEGDCGSSRPTPRGSRPWIVEEQPLMEP